MARLVLILTNLAMLVAAAPAAATYPGRNGPIAYVDAATGSDTDEPPGVTVAIVLQRSRAAEPRDLVSCFTPDDAPSDGDCTASQFSSLSFSPDGKLIAFDAG